jgi:hypothetical protein
MGEMRSTYKIFVGKSKGIKLKTNMRISLKEPECEAVNRTYLVRDMDP